MDGLIVNAILNEEGVLTELIAVVVVGSILRGMWWLMKQLRKNDDGSD